MKYFLLILFFVAGAVHAEFYRSIDEHGNVVYSDKPSDNAEKIELKEMSTYTPAPIVEVEPAAVTEVQATTEIAAPDYQIEITSPQQNEAFWSNGGTVDVVASVQPELNSERGDLVQFSLDGKAVGGPQSALTITIDDVERGSHILLVTVVDKQGNTLQRSKSLLFHLHRHSVAQ